MDPQPRPIHAIQQSPVPLTGDQPPGAEQGPPPPPPMQYQAGPYPAGVPPPAYPPGPPGSYPVGYYSVPAPVPPRAESSAAPVIAGVFLIIAAVGGLVMAGLGFARPVPRFNVCGTFMVVGVVFSILGSVLCFKRRSHAMALVCCVLVGVAAAMGGMVAVFLTVPPPPNVAFACAMAVGGGGGGPAAIAFLAIMSRRQDFSS